MAHDTDDCETCQALATTSLSVEVEVLSDDRRRYVPSVPVPGEPASFASAVEARFHPLARFLWPGGVSAVALEPSGVTVDKSGLASWDFIEPILLAVISEQLTLQHYAKN
ncbi:MAG: hypothetical protein R3F61_02360 [Myxococcota bacterium]